MNVELQIYRFNHRNSLWLFRHGLGFMVKFIRSLKHGSKYGIYPINKNRSG